ncbi:hypothetical protein [Clostridium algidicarnis]|uniref:hypothetical protein n=1 Tax=Clostridium algidicarnis TaxID=37659 RepID=UPI001C0BDE6E|nr:hypothetical protein [Clostridium algidicarnis]MBU3205072.1 hypothetical protein [Clostridium algidicarnis]MBU3213225.1 hypothetical protein [Clostridium algidicarnis]MBU3223880.1 hypothetical protein [Clostridium algidicarnis]
MLKNFKKSIIALIASTILILSHSSLVHASTNDFFSDAETQKAYSEHKDSLIEKGFEKHSASDVKYYKYELKEEAKEKKVNDITLEDYNFVQAKEQDFINDSKKKQYYIKDESKNKKVKELKETDFITNKENTIMTRAIPSEEVSFSDYNTSGVVKISLSVHRDSTNKNNFIVTHAFSWTRSPNGSFTDALAIRVSPTMIVVAKTNKAYMNGTIEIPYNQPIIDNVAGKYVFDNLGAGYEVKTKGAYSSLNGFASVQVAFSDQTSSNKTGNVYGEYISTKLGGSLSIDSSGRPSIGFSPTNTVFNTGVTVTNY